MKVPKLRFKDDDGREFSEWEIHSLESICDSNSPITYGVLKPGEYYENGVHLIQIRDIVDGKIRFENLHRISNDLDKEYRRSRIKTNDILISLIGTIGRIAIVPNQLDLANIHRNIGRIRTSHYKFIYHFLNSSAVAKEIELISSGSSQSALNLSVLREIKIPIPETTEQTKIANFLTAIDEKITQLTQKCDLLAQYKKGVMQQIFSQKLRFKDDDGREFPEWEEKGLGDVTEIIMGQSPDSNSYNNLEKGKPLIQGKADIANRKTSPRVWTTSPVKECNINDIILTVRAPVGAVAISYHNACIGRGVCAIRTNKETILSYIYQLLLWFEPTKWISLEQGSTFTAVNSMDIKTIVIPLPSIAEQTKIANFLTAIDGKITQAQTQLDAVKRYKKGLLQQMFV